jgi:hypothetical protein
LYTNDFLGVHGAVPGGQIQGGKSGEATEKGCQDFDEVE